MINLRQVKSVLAVVEAGSVNRAAEVLCLAPSSVSAQLRELSSGLGVNLFDSSGRGLVLSAAGRQLLPKFQQMLALEGEISSTAQALVSEPAGELRLYAPSSMCIYRLPPLIEGLQSLASGIELHLQHDPFDYRQALAERSIEAAILVLDKPEPGCDSQRVAAEEVIYVAHPSLVVAETLTPEQLQRRMLITTEPACSYRMAAEQHFKQQGLKLSPRQCFSNVEVIRRCLLAKMGVGLLPRCVVEEDIAAGRLLQQNVSGAPYCFESTVVWPSEAEISPRLNLFLQVVRGC
ncbi:MAG: LysR family transcriptional regulator [Granulosicoccaceae bacterium]